jgi:hypothetical protein
MEVQSELRMESTRRVRPIEAKRWLACGSAPKRDLPLIKHRRLKLFKKAMFDEVPIGADRDPA